MASVKHVLKFSSIMNYFSGADEIKLISRGENAVESNHIKSFHFVANLGLLKGEIHASMRDRVDNVQVELNEDSIRKSECNCPRGQYLCHHVAALCIYGHYNISVTDTECRWTARKPKEEDVKRYQIYTRRKVTHL
ncbi:uncharacterized protein LOC115883790 [Sitophilus oryzae]|uniref:Uncharacterized protein LOC115883790 n=1 Tax=Sitophilus oryzae TaxID=7048 RepID=A0A6J2Y2X3_SITOR|nr:uncharacterized protein LOC115883790 [Sitophilus oryzae]